MWYKILIQKYVNIICQGGHFISIESIHLWRDYLQEQLIFELRGAGSIFNYRLID